MVDYYACGPLLVIGYHAYPVYGRVHEVLGPLDIVCNGFLKGQRFPLSTLHEEYVVGFGQIIYQTDWVKKPEPDNFTPYNYVGFYEATVNSFRSGSSVMWYWRVYLQYTIRIPPPVKPRDSTSIFNPPPLPSRAMPSQLTQFDTFGRPIVYSAGARRIAGAKIWALDLIAGDPTINDPAIGSWAEAFGYPLFPQETFYINRLWADGHLLFVAPEGPNSDELGDVVEGMEDLTFEIYYGTETQLPCPIIVADKGADRTPAFRGLIYIVLDKISLVTFGNRYPSLSAEFLRTADDPISVADVLERVGEIGGVTVVCENIDDMADGVVFETFNPRSILQDYREQYNYRIIDGDPVRLVRRLVGTSLVVDWILNPDTDLVSTSPTDEVSLLERREDSELPNEVNITFQERSFNYQQATQYARRPHFPVQATHSEDIVSQRTDFIISAVKALSIAYDMLYLIWTRRLTANFTVRPEFSEMLEADTVRLPTPQGTYVFDITHRTLEPNQQVSIEADCLLAESGVEVDADSGAVGRRVRPACYYPQMLTADNDSGDYNIQSIMTSDGRFWHSATCYSANTYVGGVLGWSVVNADAVPSRLSLSQLVPNVTGPAPLTGGQTYANYSACSGTLEESNYFYRVFPSYGQYPVNVQQPILHQFAIQRIDKSSLAAEVMLVNSVFGATGEAAADPQSPIGPLAMFDGKIYFCTPSYSSDQGVFGQYSVPMRMWSVDVHDWKAVTDAEMTIMVPAVPASSNVLQGYIVGAVSVSVYILFATVQAQATVGANSWTRMYRYNTSDGVLDYVSLDHKLGRAVARGDYAYFLPCIDFTSHPGGGTGELDTNQTHGARVHAPTMDIIYFDTLDDPDIFSVPRHAQPWLTTEHLCYLVDNFTFAAGQQVFQVMAPRICRRQLSDLAPVSNFDLTPHLDISYHQPTRGVSDDTWHFITGHTWLDQLGGHGILLRVSTFDPNTTILTPYTLSGVTAGTADNDMFANAETIELNTIVSFYNEFATKEAGEGNHGDPLDPGGRSLWWTFTAPVDDYYSIGNSDQAGNFFYFIATQWNYSLYTGTLLANLVELVNRGYHNQSPVSGVYYSNRPPSVPLAAGTKTYFAMDGTTRYGYPYEPGQGPYGYSLAWFGQGSFKFVRDFSLLNNNFADAFNIVPGQTLNARNRFANKEAGEPDHAGNIGGKSMWWKFTPTVESVYSFDTNGSSFATLLAVYEANNPASPNVDDLVEIGGSGEGSQTDDGHISPEDWAAWKIVAF